MKTLEKLMLSAVMVMSPLVGCRVGEKVYEEKGVQVYELKAPSICAGELRVEATSRSGPTIYCMDETDRALACVQITPRNDDYTCYTVKK